MKRISEIVAMQAQSREWQRAGLRVGLVPTMGYLHDGHLSLVRAARERADRVVVSIFVNPSQFGPREDLAAYPRDLERDAALCAAAGVDAIFIPTAEAMYPPAYSTWIEEEQLSKPLCGESRPGHFRGVCTIVAKLFNACLPEVAVFGQKDAQQALVIQRLTRDLNFSVEIVVAPIIREPGGLAMSSRNVYLAAEERERALSIQRGLRLAGDAFANGERRAAILVSQVRREIVAAGGDIDYVDCRATNTLDAITCVDRPALIAVAARFGKTRLLDNLQLTP